MLSPRDAWHATLGQLQLQLNRATFDTWLKGAELVSADNNEFVVRVRHAYAKDWLEKHQQFMITQALSNIYAQPVTLRFVVNSPSHQPRSERTGPLWDLIREQTEAANAAEPDTPGKTTSRTIPTDSDYREWDPRFNKVERTPIAERADLFKTPLNKRFTFDSFVVGASNRFAYAAAQAVAETPGATYNPLYIYGEVGLGKTHLLQAIGHACEAAGKHVIYITAETFTNELVMAIRAHTTAEFRERYRRADVLLVDDIQFMAGKNSTEEEFYHTFNTLCDQNGQIVVVGTKPPRAIKKLDERLRTRLEGGLMADIQPPEEDTRRAILEAKATSQNAVLPPDVAQVLAQQEITNVRELEGLLTQVLARATLTRQPLSVELAQSVLGKHLAPKSTAPRKASLDDILQATATYHQLSLDDMLSKRRTKMVVRARHIAMYLAREETDASLPQIGEAMGGRNHSTIHYGYQKIAQCVDDDAELRKEVTAIRHQLYQRL
jgi:chromosomal replication initiator protein